LNAALQTQKPVTQGCGRAFGETIHFDKNTMPDRTSQLVLELLFHSPLGAAQYASLLRLTGLPNGSFMGLEIK
jgi:hypothetical protein